MGDTETQQQRKKNIEGCGECKGEKYPGKKKKKKKPERDKVCK